METSELASPGTLYNLGRYCLRQFRSIEITYPVENQIMPEGKFELTGRYTLRLGGNFVVCHRDGNKFWPHGRVNFHGSNRTWRADFTLSRDFPKEAFDIVVVEINEVASVLVEFYFTIGLAGNWPPITMPSYTKGFDLRAELKVQIRPS